MCVYRERTESPIYILDFVECMQVCILCKSNICIGLCMYASRYMYIHTYIHTVVLVGGSQTLACIRIYIHIYVYSYIYMYMHTYIYMYIHTYIYIVDDPPHFSYVPSYICW